MVLVQKEPQSLSTLTDLAVRRFCPGGELFDKIVSEGPMDVRHTLVVLHLLALHCW